jgi:hypothetical protein
MAAVFGIEERNAQGFIGEGIVCFHPLSNRNLSLRGAVSPIKNEDIIFIKHCSAQSSLQIEAVGIVRSEFPVQFGADFCLPVEWVWQGRKTIDHFDEKLSSNSDELYEEHDIMVQREVIDLLPQKYQLHPEW